MKLKLYSTTDDDNVIGKTLLNEIEIDIRLKNDTDIVNPMIRLSSIPNVDFKEYNYAHIPELERFYFLDNITNVNSRVWDLSFACDVLETYKTDILNSNARLYRNIKTGDYMNVSIDSNIMKTVSKFDGNVTIENQRSLILTTVGV